jgi:hypothetical protein
MHKISRTDAGNLTYLANVGDIRRGLLVFRSGDHEKLGGNELFDLFLVTHGECC